MQGQVVLYIIISDSLARLTGQSAYGRHYASIGTTVDNKSGPSVRNDIDKCAA